MKVLLRGILCVTLAWLSRRVLVKYHPTIIMVTGSVGKTSTKDAVVAAFSSYTDVRGSEKSFNSEIGVPLTIIGAKNPWENPSAWGSVFWRGMRLLTKQYAFPKVLVLEVGADRPGDLKKILKIATPDAVVVTRLPDVPVHVEAYASVQAVKDEEFTPAYALADGAPLILAHDNEYALSMGKKTRAQLVTFGFGRTSDVGIVAPSIYVEGGEVIGMESCFVVEGEQHPYIVRGALGTHQMLAPAAALATALALNVPLKKALQGLKSYMPPAGRARVLRGIHGSHLIDDTYNASPVAVEEALTSLALFPTQGKRIAVLGDMLELGRYSVGEHESVGLQAAKAADLIVSVGVRARAIGQKAIDSGVSSMRVIFLDSANAAAEKLPELVGADDVVLIKGSQGMRMERVVEALLEEEKDVKYLVRQEEEWKRRR